MILPFENLEGTPVANPSGIEASACLRIGLTPAWLDLKLRTAAADAGVADLSDQEKQMKPSTKDQIQGKLHELKGTVKQKAGQATNNPNLEAKGQSEKLAGKIQKKVGQIEEVLEK